MCHAYIGGIVYAILIIFNEPWISWNLTILPEIPTALVRYRWLQHLAFEKVTTKIDCTHEEFQNAIIFKKK